MSDDEMVAAENTDVLKEIVVPETLHVNGKVLQTSRAKPLSLGDQRELKRKGANIKDLSKTGDPDVLAELLFLFCKKMNPDISMDDIDTLTNKDMAVLGKLVKEADGDTDRPI